MQQYADIYFAAKLLYKLGSKLACFPDSMLCTRGCNYSFTYSWWWARWTPETCRV